MEFEENSRLTNDQLSRAHEMIENQALEITKYVTQLEEFEETISGSHITIVDWKPIPNSKLSEEDINQLQSKIPELKDMDTALDGGLNTWSN